MHLEAKNPAGRNSRVVTGGCWRARRGLREILHLRWEHVDFERGCLFLPDSKTGRKTVILNAPALAVLSALERVGPYVVSGDDPAQPRHDLKRPWDAVTKHAGLVGVRLHDLRHTYASFGAGGGLGLPIIGRLLGHAQTATTARYAHLDNDPLQRASEAIAGAHCGCAGRKRADKCPDASWAGLVARVQEKRAQHHVAFSPQSRHRLT
jgi:integrase